MKKSILTLLTLFLSFFSEAQSTQWVNEHQYPNCIQIQNDSVRVVLDPNVGGRVLVYEKNGKNVLWVNEKMDGMLWDDSLSKFEVSAGRFDIGPEKTTPKRNQLFKGKWTAEIVDQSTAKLTSIVDPLLEVQLVRVFKLSPNSSQLSCTQTIINKSAKAKSLAHWGRTFVKGGGICYVPLNPYSRLPKGYALYNKNPRNSIDINPAEEENIVAFDSLLVIKGKPSRPKFVMDSDKGWIAYSSKNDLLFLKTFEISTDKVYGDVIGNSISVWYYENEKCELEPIGPLELIGPNQEVSYTENWYLFDYPFKSENASAPNEVLNKISPLL
ncbi:hypothetical protein [Sediminitomix flava]|uniref:Uncharacterized protein n=1 Tax=Sediminitomix flava TaxID=379075 RepID=A0A315YZ25_SEDFL|nr:hypothetical protein [Sediminitomix flava]PWJ35010.1 hypothetical protein BC781_11051 [Sediminitomix flava]